MTFPATITNSWKMGNLKGQRKEKKKTKQNKHLHDVDGKVSQWCKLARSQQRSSTIGY